MKHLSGAETRVAEIRQASKIWFLRPIIMPVSGVTVFRYAIGTIYSDSFCCLKLRKKHRLWDFLSLMLRKMSYIIDLNKFC
jgi:hypothetical protein